METFHQMQQFALTWAVAGMAVFFVLVVAWVFRPGSSKVHEDVARSIFRNDTKPVGDGPAPAQVARAGARSAAKGA
jgi:cytochrome c oxidase cbb3-type subunit IV